MLRASLAILALFTSACTVTPQSSDSRSRYYIGIVRVAYPEKFGNMVAMDVATLGLGADDAGGFIGYRHGRFVYVKPGECRLIVIARDAGDIAHLRKMLDATGENICLVQGQSPSSSPELPVPPR